MDVHGLRPAPLRELREDSRAALLVGLGLRVVLAAAAIGLLAGVVELAAWEPAGPGDDRPVVEVCTDPPCPPESLPDELWRLPLLLHPLGHLFAALLGASALLLSSPLLSRPLRSGTSRRRRPGPRSRRRLLPVLGPVVVLVALELVPHLVNPCLVAGTLRQTLPAGCVRTVHGVDVHDRWHALHHAAVGGLPAALGYAALLRRRRPELFATSGTGRDPAPDEVEAEGRC